MKSTARVYAPLTSAKASDIMSQPVISVFIKDSIRSVADLFVRKDISGAPVLGEDGYVVGVMTKTDLARYDKQRVETLARERLIDGKALETAEEIPAGGFHVDEDETIEAWFNPKVYWVSPDDSLARVTETMWKHHVHHLLVKATSSKDLAGVITTFDLLRFLAPHL